MNYSTGFDWRQFAAFLAIGAALAALIAWQSRGTPDKCRNWLGSSALTLEALAMAMAVFWAVRQGAGVLALFFVAGFIGLSLAKAVTISALVQAHREQKRGAFGVLLLAASGAYVSVYSAGVFEGTMHSAGQQATAAAQSAPVLAIESELTAARSRLASLAPYADAGKANQEEQAQARALAAMQSELTAARAELARWAHSDCTPKKNGNGIPFTSRAAGACAAVKSIEGRAGIAPGGYASRHSEYLGLQSHIAALEKQRAGMLQSGAGASVGEIGADDELVLRLFGLDSIKQAAGVKWLFFVLIFDMLSLFLRLGGELLQGRDVAGETARRMRALLDAGVPMDQALGAMGGAAAGDVRPGPGFVAMQPQAQAHYSPPPEIDHPAPPGRFVGFVPPGFPGVAKPGIPQDPPGTAPVPGGTHGPRPDPVLADGLAARAAGCEYEEVRRLVIKGELKPSKRALMDSCGKGATWALNTLRQLAAEEIIVLSRNGYEVNKEKV
jgi:hypothetical protein